MTNTREFEHVSGAVLPAPVTSAAVRTGIDELEQLMRDAAAGTYTPDSFTFQPLRVACAEQDKELAAIRSTCDTLKSYGFGWTDNTPLSQRVADIADGFKNEESEAFGYKGQFEDIAVERENLVAGHSEQDEVTRDLMAKVRPVLCTLRDEGHTQVAEEINELVARLEAAMK